MSNKKYCGIVVWYHPNNECMTNIMSYADEIDKLFIIDNSENDNSYLLSGFIYKSKCIYIGWRNNRGLAYALNYGCRQAIKEGYEYILTMDQDSMFEKGGAKALIDFEEQNMGCYAIVAPNVKSMYRDKDGNASVAFVEIDGSEEKIKKWVMTSGSLMSLETYLEVGGFDDALFIQHIDVDFGIKLHKADKKIIQIGKAVLQQHFSNSEPRKILWGTVHPGFDRPVKQYYTFRNERYLEKKYGKDIRGFIGASLLWKSVIKITLFENKKIEKYRMMLRGIYDARKNIMGEFSCK